MGGLMLHRARMWQLSAFWTQIEHLAASIMPSGLSVHRLSRWQVQGPAASESGALPPPAALYPCLERP